MKDTLYREHILQHYKEPHNKGSLDDPDVTAEVAGSTCGDELRFEANIEDGTVTDIKFDGSGCALSVATTSLLTDEIAGMDVSDITELDEEDVFELVGMEKDEVSPLRVKCVLIGLDGVQKLVDQ